MTNTKTKLEKKNFYFKIFHEADAFNVEFKHVDYFVVKCATNYQAIWSLFRTKAKHK